MADGALSGACLCGVAGEINVVRFRSSKEATRSFCGICGSTMFFESSRWPNEIHITLAHLKDPLDRGPDAKVFFDHRARWVFHGDKLKRLGGWTGTEPLDNK